MIVSKVIQEFVSQFEAEFLRVGNDQIMLARFEFIHIHQFGDGREVFNADWFRHKVFSGLRAVRGSLCGVEHAASRQSEGDNDCMNVIDGPDYHKEDHIHTNGQS